MWKNECWLCGRNTFQTMREGQVCCEYDEEYTEEMLR